MVFEEGKLSSCKAASSDGASAWSPGTGGWPPLGRRGRPLQQGNLKLNLGVVPIAGLCVPLPPYEDVKYRRLPG